MVKEEEQDQIPRVSMWQMEDFAKLTHQGSARIRQCREECPSPKARASLRRELRRAGVEFDQGENLSWTGEEQPAGKLEWSVVAYVAWRPGKPREGC